MQKTYQSVKCCNIGDMKSPPGMIQCQAQYKSEPDLAWMVGNILYKSIKF